MNAKILIATLLGLALILLMWAPAAAQETQQIQREPAQATLSEDVSRAELLAGAALLEKYYKLSDVRLERVRGTVDLSAAEPHLALTHTLVNPGDEEKTVRLSLPGVEARQLRLAPGGRGEMTWNVPLKVQPVGRLVRGVEIRPQLQVEESPAFKPVERFDVEVMLPPEAKKLVKASKTLEPTGQRDGRLVYTWTGQNEYLTTLNLWWTESDVDLALSKRVEVDRRGDTATVKVKVRNAGTIPARGVVLKEDFPSQSYAEVSGSEGDFSLYRGEENDQRLIWQYPLAELAPGEEKVVTYRLKLLHPMPDVRLHETRALLGGEPIAVSEPVVARM